MTHAPAAPTVFEPISLLSQMLLRRVVGLPNQGEFAIAGILNDQLLLVTLLVQRMTGSHFYFTDCLGYNYRLPKSKFQWMVHRLNDALYLTSIVRPMYYRSSGDGRLLHAIVREFDEITIEVHGIVSSVDYTVVEHVIDEPPGPLLASVHVDNTPLYQLMTTLGAGEMVDRVRFRDFVQNHRLPKPLKTIPMRPYYNTGYGQWFTSP